MKHPYTNFTIYQSNRSIATYALIDELDIGVVTNFLPDDAARGTAFFPFFCICPFFCIFRKV